MKQTFFLTVKGSKQGTFEGESKKSKTKGLELLGYSFGVSSPRSAGSGQATGKRVYEPLIVSKEVGPASIQFFQALVTGEILTDVELTIYKINRNGKDTAYFRIKLTNALVSEITHEPGVEFSGDLADSSEVETVSFTFQKIEMENLAANTSAMDDLSGKA